MESMNGLIHTHHLDEQRFCTKVSARTPERHLRNNVDMCQLHVPFLSGIFLRNDPSIPFSYPRNADT